MSDHFAALGKRVRSEWDPSRVGTVTETRGEVRLIEWDNEPPTWCYLFDIEPEEES